MYRNSFQGGASIELLSAKNGLGGSWSVSRATSATRVYDSDLRGYVIQYEGPSTVSLSHPPAREKSVLGITQPYLCFQIQVTSSLFSLEIICTDQQQQRHRVYFSPSFHTLTTTALHAQVPISFPTDVWLNAVFDLNSLCRAFFQTQFASLDSIVVHPSCRLRAVFSLLVCPPPTMTPIGTPRQSQTPRDSSALPSRHQYPAGVTVETLLIGSQFFDTFGSGDIPHTSRSSHSVRQSLLPQLSVASVASSTPVQSARPTLPPVRQQPQVSSARQRTSARRGQKSAPSPQQTPHLAAPHVVSLGNPAPARQASGQRHIVPPSSALSHPRQPQRREPDPAQEELLQHARDVLKRPPITVPAPQKHQEQESEDADPLDVEPVQYDPPRLSHVTEFELPSDVAASILEFEAAVNEIDNDTSPALGQTLRVSRDDGVPRSSRFGEPLIEIPKEPAPESPHDGPTCDYVAPSLQTLKALEGISESFEVVHGIYSPQHPEQTQSFSETGEQEQQPQRAPSPPCLAPPDRSAEGTSAQAFADSLPSSVLAAPDPVEHCQDAECSDCEDFRSNDQE